MPSTKFEIQTANLSTPHQMLNDAASNLLMDLDEARECNDLIKDNIPRCPVALNKQSEEKAGTAYYTGTVNI